MPGWHAGSWKEFAGQCGTRGADNGARGTATFNHPKGMCMTGGGQLIVVDSMNACVRSIDLESGMSLKFVDCCHQWQCQHVRV